MNAPEVQMGFEIMGIKIGMSYLNCALVEMEAFFVGAWNPTVTITPTYGNNRVSSLSVVTHQDLGIPLEDYSIQLNFNYDTQNKLEKIDVKLLITVPMPAPLPPYTLPLTVAMIENTYENGLLKDSTMHTTLGVLADLNLPDMPPIQDIALSHSFTYNSDNSIASITALFDGDYPSSYVLAGRRWFDYPPVRVPSYVKNELKLFPNPAENTMQLIAEEPVVKINVYDLLGKEVLSLDNINDCKTDISVQNLSAGQYIVKVQTTKAILTKKFIKQ
jgi:hypothetical protein